MTRNIMLKLMSWEKKLVNNHHSSRCQWIYLRQEWTIYCDQSNKYSDVPLTCLSVIIIFLWGGRFKNNFAYWFVFYILIFIGCLQSIWKFPCKTLNKHHSSVFFVSRISLNGFFALNKIHKYEIKARVILPQK